MDIFIGLLIIAAGAFCQSSSYTPINKVREWTWETYWLVQGVFAWIVFPLLGALLAVPDGESLIALYASYPRESLLTIFFGMLWGVGGLTFGLSMRYLGLGLGVAVALGTCAVFGTLIPPIVGGKFLDVLTTPGGQIVMMGVVVGVLGIVVNGIAGVLKERDSSNNEALPEFNLPKGICVAVVSGILSAGFAFSLSMGEPIAETARKIAVDTGALAPESADFFKNNATLVVTLWGGFISNFLICGYMILQNKSLGDIYKAGKKMGIFNFILCAVAGVCWYGQFFFYGMGTTQLGKEYDFSSWSLHMSFIIVFAAIWALGLREWKGSGTLTKCVLWVGILILVCSAFIIGLGQRA